MKKTLGAVAAAAAIAMSLSACGGGSSPSTTSGEAKGEINYWLWDANQLPAYQQCAADFTKANPDIKVKITQRGWDDYWTTLTNGFVAGNAPDVFTDHLSKYPEYAAKKQLLALDEAVEKDGVKLDIYNEGLADLWVGQDGKRYGLPKDWDTVAMFYNKKLVKDAGYTEEQLADLDWNPQDGGSYEKAIAHLTVDKSGKRGDEPGFNKNNVAVYGLGLENSGNGQGQTQWSFLTGTTGWTHTDKNPWGTKFNYDDPKFQETIKWWAGLADKGYMPKLETTVGASVADAFGAGKAAINTNGSWMIGQYTGYKGIQTGIAPTPKGPDGKRAQHVQRPGRLHLGRHQEPGCFRQVGRVPGLQRLPGRRSLQGRRLPRHQELLREGCRGLQNQGHRRQRLHHSREGRHHVPLPHYRERGEGRRSHGTGNGRCAVR